ncbi:MAG: DUF1638 domain-containing protein [Pirellulales bacterium]|nr:DUF1638 domain-containing protein [Pirellulales bacterium]
MHLKLIACEILYRELCAVVARSPNRVDFEFLPKGLHDIGQAGMSARLREVLQAVDPSQYDAVVLGYGLCSNGVVGLAAETVPLVVPRAHDCITLFLGDKDRYLEYFQSHPGVYFKTSGWIERGEGLAQLGSDAIPQAAGMTATYHELAAKYGEDNARYLYEQLGNMTRHYQKLTFIEMGIEPDDRFERQTEQEAAQRGWQYEKLAGDMGLIRALVDGPWDPERFLVVEPGCRVAASFDDAIVQAVKEV